MATINTKTNKIYLHKTLVFYLVFQLISLAYCQFDLAPEIPSHLPAPPKKPDPPPTNSGNGTGQQAGGLQDGSLPFPPPQNAPFGPGLGLLPQDFVPFGLNHIILIIVPQFKSKYQKLPDWIASSIRISMPITVFFDQLDVPPGMFIPGPGGLPPLPIGMPPTGPLPPTPPAGPSPVPPNVPVAGVYNHMSPSYYGGYYSHRPHLYGHSYDDDADGDAEDSNSDGYDNEDNYYPEEERSLRRRRKREACFNQTKSGSHVISETYKHQFHLKNKRQISFNHKVHKSERASIIPKLEKILHKAGLEGKPCVLRAICEVHEAPLDHYGLLGELLTVFFSISRSMFAKSHLQEYAMAEELGRAGDCSKFHQQCKNTMFSWEDNESKESKLTLF